MQDHCSSLQHLSIIHNLHTWNTSECTIIFHSEHVNHNCWVTMIIKKNTKSQACKPLVQVKTVSTWPNTMNTSPVNNHPADWIESIFSFHTLISAWKSAFHPVCRVVVQEWKNQPPEKRIRLDQPSLSEKNKFRKYKW